MLFTVNDCIDKYFGVGILFVRNLAVSPAGGFLGLEGEEIVSEGDLYKMVFLIGIPFVVVGKILFFVLPRVLHIDIHSRRSVGIGCLVITVFYFLALASSYLPTVPEGTESSGAFIFVIYFAAIVSYLLYEGIH